MGYKHMTQAAANDRSQQGIHSRWVDIDVNGERMESYMAWPSGTGPWPAVVVLMEIFGVNAHMRSVVERIAAEGYVAIAPNYYHRTTQNMELGYTEQDVAIGHKHKDLTTREGILVDIRAAIQFLQSKKDVEPKERMGCIGFCYGGHVSLIAASMKEIAVTASFYAGAMTREWPTGGAPTITHFREIEGKVLCLFGEADPIIPHEETVIIAKALQEAHVRHEIIRYANTGHGFFCDQRESYDPSAAEDAWLRVKALFNRTLNTQPSIKTPSV